MPKISLLLGVVLLSTLSQPLLAQKLYKWVDKNGVTHFSQTPPPEQEATGAKVQQLEARDTRELKPRREGRHLYCGEERLREYGDHAATKIANLEQQIIDLKRNINRMMERRADAINRSWTYQKNAHSSEVKGYDTQLAVERCKLGWAEDQLAELSGERKKIAERASTMSVAIEDIERQKVASCGVDNRTGFIKVDEGYRAYLDCVAPFDREIKKLQREQRAVERDRKLVEGK